jgi:predicted nucleotide-binding protein (sugar kinase/HSP70/actin superfamily)
VIFLNKRLKIGIPQAMLYHTYGSFIDAFAETLPADIVYSGNTDRDILESGVKFCPDDACLPVKVLTGHIDSLKNRCDAVAVPRIMTCEYGESLCPKMNGLPELTGAATEYKKQIFTERIDLNNERKLFRQLMHECRRLGFSRSDVRRAFAAGMDSWKNNGEKRICDTGFQKRVFLAAHSYNAFDAFINMRLLEKLHKMDIGIITDGAVPYEYKKEYSDRLMKKPFWKNLTSQYGAAMWLEENALIDGIICMSSFSCGTDSVTASLISEHTALPVLTLKIDEQTGEAGFDTRLEAYREVLFS